MAGDVQFKINGKTYDTATLDQISLRDVVLFNSQARAMGLEVTWSDMERIGSEMVGDSDVEHPDAMLMFAVTVWAARRTAGDDVTLDEALSVPMKDIEIAEAPKVPKERSKKKSSRTTPLASAPAIADDSTSSTPAETTPETSSSKSVSA